jgi:benzoyl-CoA reductase subunit C
MKALQEIQELMASHPSPNRFIEEGMEKGKKVCGYLCIQVVEEIIEAGDMLPVRVFGDNTVDTSLGDAYLHTNNCPYTRACMSFALKGGYKHFDALVAGNLCDHIRRLADEWVRFVKEPKHYFFFWVPFKQTDRAITAFRGELEKMKTTIEGASGRKITNDDLNEQIAVYNEMRQLFKEIAEYRKQPSPPILGSEFMEAILVAQQSPKAEINTILKELLAELPSAPGRGTGGPRVMMIGSELDDPAFVRVIEEAGATVVADDLCTGYGYFWNEVEPNEADPLHALADRYIKGIVCPRMTPPWGKHDLIKYMLKEYKIDAVIYTVLKFCEPHISHWTPVSEIVKEAGIPSLWLERDYMSGGALGQVKTRVEAFMEQLLDI